MRAAPRPRVIAIAAVIAAAAAFGIGFLVGTPAEEPTGEPLPTLAAPATPTIPALADDLSAIPALAAPPVTPRITGGSSGASTPGRSGRTTSVPDSGGGGGIIAQ